MSEKPKIAIIGMGFLMSYLKPCYHNLYGENLSENITASTATASTVKKKSEAMGFPVQCQDYYNMLVNFEPDMIFFAPPPSAAKEMAKDILAPYYSMLRKKGSALPDLYAYPPSPDGEFYLKTIGNDINVVNILPNMACKLKGKDISKESYTIFNIPDGHPWPEKNFKRLDAFFSPIGYNVVVPANNFHTMLGGFVASHLSEELAMAVSKGLSETGINIEFSKLASSMRYSFLKNNNRHFENALPCSLTDDEKLDSVLENIIMAWMEGMADFSVSQNMDEQLANDIIIPQIDIFLQSAQLLTAEEIEYNNSCHATKGGILEKALFVYNGGIKQKIEKTLAEYKTFIFDKSFYDFVKESGFLTAKEVSDHGRKFAD